MGHEIKVAIIFLTLISVSLIKWRVNFCDLNFHYFGHKFSIYFVRGVFCQGGDSPVTVKLWRTLKVARLRSTPFERLGKEPRTKFPFGITHRLTLFLLSQHVQGFVSCHVNVLHFELSPSWLPLFRVKFPLFESRFLILVVYLSSITFQYLYFNGALISHKKV